MTAEQAAAIFLIGLPIAFNVAFTLLARSFDYPDILRRPTDEILRRFDAGGSRLRTLWWAFMLTAVAMLPLAALVGAVLVGSVPTLAWLSMVIGTAAAIVQALGLARWPFVVPELARRWIAAEEGPAGDPQRAAIDAVFTALHRYAGVGVGEHLGYLLTGAWTVVVGLGFALGGPVPAVVGWVAIPIGAALAVGSLEFVGPNEPAGWSLAGRIVPIAYIAWSIWMLALGVALLVS